MTGSQLVPFGKYKDQPVDALMQDRSYCEWLLAQAWVQQKYPKFVQVIIAGGVEPQDTPEHNAMQAQFLDPAWFGKICQILKSRLKPEKLADYDGYRENVFDAEFVGGSLKGSITHSEFEFRGWDVSCQLTIWGELDVRLVRRISEGGRVSWEETPSIERRQGFQTEERVLLELKPSLSDDYPTVLREMKARRCDPYDRVFLIARDASFQHVSWGQVQAIFETAGIAALLESDIAP